MKKKKILILVNQLSFFISHRLPIAEAALAEGFDVVIAYGEVGRIGTDPNLLEQKGFKTKYISMYRGGTNLFNDLKTCFYIWKFFKKEKPDIVHLIANKPYLYGGIISRILRVPSLLSTISGLGTLFVSKDLKIRFLRFILNPIYKLTFNHKNQIIIIQNKSDLKELVEWGVLNPIKTKLLKGSGVKIENYTHLDEPSGTPIICFAARLLRDKGVYEFISAGRLLKKRGIKVRLLLAGDLDENNRSGLSADDLAKLKEEASIEVLGYQKDIPKLYSKSHIICLPSYREGLPKSLIEAAAASRAIVTTDVPGCRDSIISGKTGLLVPVKDHIKLADALQWLIEHPKERIAMGQAGRKLAEKEFIIEKIVKKHIEIYKELISKAL